MALRIFVSYARNDNQLPLNQEGVSERERHGFVKTLLRRTETWLTDFGVGDRVHFDLDERLIKEDDQFDSLIRRQLQNADLLLVVLSKNWLQRRWCLKELDLFRERWSSDGEAKQHIIVVNKHEVNRDELPPLLQGQNGVRFYVRDRDQRGGIFEYFTIDRGAREEFNGAAQRLAAIIRARAEGDFSPVADDASGSEEKARETEKPRRRVFVAKPAPDMREWYQKLVRELTEREYTIVPDPNTQFSGDMTETELCQVLDAVLRDAEISIHLLGNSLGFTPTDGTQSIVRLQCARAAERGGTRPHNAAGVAFQRLFWAPKILVKDGEPVDEGRDPQHVYENAAEAIADDKYVGEAWTSFKQFVLERLEALKPVPLETSAELPKGTSVYVQYQEQDADYARGVVDALIAKDLDPDIPTFSGPNARKWHLKMLQECDAVVVCWAQGDDEPIRSKFSELRTVRRERPFLLRSLVAGPPRELTNKENTLDLLQRKKKEVDIVLDLTAYPVPPPEAFDVFLDAAKHGESAEAS